MVNIYPILKDIKTTLSEINGVKSLRIGLEKGADSAINTPLVRIVVEKTEAKGLNEDLIFQVILAFDTKNDLELLYEKFYEMEYTVKELLMSKLPYEIYFLSSVSDEDRLNSIKAGVLRFRLVGLYRD